MIGGRTQLWYTDEMKIRLIAHSGFYAELPEADLLFDYYYGELPVPDPGKPLFVFVSHRHADHFSEKIFDLAEQTERIAYIISDDVPLQKIPEKLRGKTLRIGAGETREIGLEKTGKSTQTDRQVKLTVRSFASTDEGVAFLVDLGAWRLYHAGDLNNWHWEEEGPAWNADQERRYNKALKQLAACVAADGKQVDVAFVPLDSRLGASFWMGMDAYMRTVGAAHVFPMHLFGDPSVIRRMWHMPCAAPYADRILGTGAEGEEFEL